MTYCKPGDLAVVVKAHNACNIGTIRGVLRRRRLGPIPDSQLRPIRGAPPEETVTHSIDLVTSGELHA
jgi:hypothetical protein